MQMGMFIIHPLTLPLSNEIVFVLRALIDHSVVLYEVSVRTVIQESMLVMYS